VYGVLIGGTAVMGIGSSIFWVALGYYTTQCMSEKTANLFFGLEWAAFILA